MDAEPVNELGVYNWPTDILELSGLQAKTIGVVGLYFDQNNRRVFVPVSVGPREQVGKEVLRFVVDYPHRLKSLSVVFREVAPAATAEWRSPPFEARSLTDQGDDLAMEADIPASKLHAGLLNVDFIGQMNSGAPAASSILVYIPVNITKLGIAKSSEHVVRKQ